MTDTKNDDTGVKKPWSLEIDEVISRVKTDPENGLGDGEVKERIEQYGRNAIRKKEKKSTWKILLEQFKSLIILLLAAAGAAAFAFDKIIEGFAIIGVIVLNTLIGFFTELKAVRSMEALQKMGIPEATVRRNGSNEKVKTGDLVPGDIVIIESGDIIPADLRVYEANKMQADESPLTGESFPVQKQEEPVDEESELAERKCMLYKGTSITRGSGQGIVVSTGMNTELGNISRMVEEAEEEQTPLEKRLNKLGRTLIWVTLGVTALMGVAGILAGKDLVLMIETAIALAVAAVPEGLPIVATVALARGMWMMSKKNALINSLSSVETLGATNLIATDKTGTLTENSMTVRRMDYAGKDGPERHDFEETDEENEFESEMIERMVKVGILCSNAELKPETEDVRGVGDPIEVALLDAGNWYGIRREDLLDEMPEEDEIAFDPDTKMMATIHSRDGDLYYAVKGAPEAILENCTKIRTGSETENLTEEKKKAWIKRNMEIASEGLRLLAFAEKTTSSKEEAYKDLTFLGLVGFMDPPRKGIKESIGDCQRAGIRVIMITGDQKETATAVGESVGLITDEEDPVLEGKQIKEYFNDESKRDELIRVPIFSRVDPAQKLDIIGLHKKNGAIVAMTGDGVNDAPALKKADIGIAMGQRGTEVAKEASDMVLKDDAFSTIVAAVKQGRIIFANIRKFATYLLSINLSEILTVGIASFFAVPLPILPLQILFLNLITGVFPALALGVGEGEDKIMDRPARDPSEPVLAKRHWHMISVYSFIIAGIVLASLLTALQGYGFSEEESVTISFLTLSFAHLWHVFNMRDRGSGILRNDISRNIWVWGAIGLCALLLIGAVYIPPLANLLSLIPPGLTGWLLILGFSVIPYILGQTGKEIFKDKRKLF
ncbi:MAG: cation-translocating P-type ATPase [Spirochaetia bacterium]